MNLSSGYILSTFDDYLKSNPSERAIIEKHCNFVVQSSLIKEGYHQINQSLAPIAVLNNIIVRGFPTFSSVYIEEQLVQISEELLFEDSDKLVQSNLNKLSYSELFSFIYQCFHKNTKSTQCI